MYIHCVNKLDVHCHVGVYVFVVVIYWIDHAHMTWYRVTHRTFNIFNFINLTLHTRMNTC